MRLYLLSLLCIAHSCLVFAVGTAESSEKTTLECFEFLQSLKRQSLDITLHSTGETEEALPITITKGSNFRSFVNYKKLSDYLCTEEMVLAEVCALHEVYDQFFSRVMFKNPNLVYQNVLTLSNNRVVLDPIDETVSYCVLSLERPDVDLIVTPHYDGNLDGRSKVNRLEHILAFLQGLLLSCVYVMKRKEWKMDKFSKYMFWYFVTGHVFVPAITVIRITFDSWNLSTLHSIVNYIEDMTYFTAFTAEDTFMTLLLRGYTVLPEAEYPLVSKYYLPVVITQSLKLLSRLLESFEYGIYGGMLNIILCLYLVLKFYKTNKLLNSLSLRSRRRHQTLNIWLFYRPLAREGTGIAIGIATNIIYHTNDQLAPTFWHPRFELIVGFLLRLVINSFDFAIIMKFTSPTVIKGAQTKSK